MTLSISRLDQRDALGGLAGENRHALVVVAMAIGSRHQFATRSHQGERPLVEVGIVAGAFAAVVTLAAIHEQKAARGRPRGSALLGVGCYSPQNAPHLVGEAAPPQGRVEAGLRWPSYGDYSWENSFSPPVRC